ncbi:MAG TPA: hypothetical protein VMV90_05305 [Rectinemataceae bacterium]|nr:hypothetical protein [Rectinemataceae bacterium]
MSFDMAGIEQIETWLKRFRSDGRRFDFVQGFATGLACALPLLGDIGDDLALLPIVDDPENFKPPAGIDREDLAEAIRALGDSLEDDLDNRDFRPYMGGRYRNRIRPDTPCAEWCRGFIISSLFYGEELRKDEDFSMLLVPVFILASPTTSDNLLAKATPQEKVEADALARKELLPSVLRIYRRLRNPDEGED